jgi:glutathione peroxidase
MSTRTKLNRFRNIATGAAMAVIGLGCAKEAPQTPEALAKWSDESLWSLEVVDIDGNKRALSEFDGRVALVVNVASRCGFTPQYEELQALYDARRNDGFVILGFPCNDFGGQESGSSEEIKTFCTTRFGVDFPMFSKVEIKDEATRSPAYELLGTQTGKLPGWNFGKYLVGSDGKAIAFFNSTDSPSGKKIQAAIDAALAPESSDKG